MDYLIEYGHTFQQKFIASLLTDKDYLYQIIDILDETKFDSEANAFIVKVIKEYFLLYNDFPTLDVFSINIKKINNDLLKTAVVENLKNIYRHIQSATDLEAIRVEALNFFKNQNLKGALSECVDLLELNKFDEIRHRLELAFRAGESKKSGHDYKKDIEKRYIEDQRNPLSTGFELIDEITDGGLGAGDLGVLIGAKGAGKSWLLVNIAANALRQGKFVIYYTLELLDTYVAKRFDTFFTGITPSSLKYHFDDINETIKNLHKDGILFTEYYPTKSVSSLSIDSNVQLNKLLQKRKPDLILVDYADLLKPVFIDRGLRTDENLSNIYQELRGIAGKYECPLWTVSQTNRAGSTKEIIQGDDISDAFSKIFIADLVGSFSRLLNDKIAGTGRFTILHNRYGADGITFPSKINFATGKITLYSPESDSGKELKKDMDNGGEVTRQYLKNKFNELNK